jgi:ABC-type Fe3+/spermidine/putrescine transport system ATPase subunit
MSHIEILGIGKCFGTHRVLADCRLSIPRGAVMTLLGPSGCGKTTLLRIIAGFLDPDEGEVRIEGRDITTLPPNRRQVGYVFQNYALFPHLTVAENVGYGLRVRRTPLPEAERCMREALEMVALGGFADRYPARLSGGQQQRVAIARARPGAERAAARRALQRARCQAATLDAGRAAKADLARWHHLDLRHA